MSTLDTPPPAIDSRHYTTLSLRDVTVQEITKIIKQAPAPMSLVKRLFPLMAVAFANMVNASFREGVLKKIP